MSPADAVARLSRAPIGSRDGGIRDAPNGKNRVFQRLMPCRWLCGGSALPGLWPWHKTAAASTHGRWAHASRPVVVCPPAAVHTPTGRGPLRWSSYGRAFGAWRQWHWSVDRVVAVCKPRSTAFMAGVHRAAVVPAMQPLRHGPTLRSLAVTLPGTVSCLRSCKGAKGRRHRVLWHAEPQSLGSSGAVCRGWGRARGGLGIFAHRFY